MQLQHLDFCSIVHAMRVWLVFQLLVKLLQPSSFVRPSSETQIENSRTSGANRKVHKMRTHNAPVLDIFEQQIPGSHHKDSILQMLKWKKKKSTS
uniref:Secreted protein n=1 Tax=Rhizophora mucronata TaxID=61149 RepID=A0A2P2PPR1_RHIMU